MSEVVAELLWRFGLLAVLVGIARQIADLRALVENGGHNGNDDDPTP